MYVYVLVLRYNLYVDCMPVDTVPEMGSQEMAKITLLARSLPGLKGNKSVVC